MGERNYYTIDEVFSHLEQDSEFQKAERRLKPYHSLVMQIIKLRSRLGLTQKDLAARANTFQSRISKIESAEHDIRLSTLIEIAEALDSEVSINLIPQHPERVLAQELFSRIENIVEFSADNDVDKASISFDLEGSFSK